MINYYVNYNNDIAYQFTNFCKSHSFHSFTFSFLLSPCQVNLLANGKIGYNATLTPPIFIEMTTPFLYGLYHVSSSIILFSPQQKGILPTRYQLVHKRKCFFRQGYFFRFKYHFIYPLLLEIPFG